MTEAAHHEHSSGAPRSRDEVIGSGVRWLATWTLRWLVLVAGVVVLGLLVQQLWSILLPLILALILTTVLQPPARGLERRLHLPPGLAAGTTILGALGVVAGLVLFVVPSIGDQVGEIADSASDGLTTIQQWVQRSDLAITQSQLDAAVDAAQSRLRSSAAGIASGVLVGVSAVTAATINLILTLVLSFFFLKDGRSFLPWAENLAGPRVGTHLAEVLSRAWQTLGGFIRTQALVGLIDAVLIGTGLVVVGVPLALPLAVLTFVAAFAPIVGAVVVGALAALVALVANGWVAALIVIAIVLVVQQLEGNVLLPYLQGRRLNLHAGVVLLAIVLGSTLFGVAGAFLSVPAVAVAAVVLRYLQEVVEDQSSPPVPPDPEPEEDPDPAAAETSTEP